MGIYLQGSLAYSRGENIGPFRAAKMYMNTMQKLEKRGGVIREDVMGGGVMGGGCNGRGCNGRGA